ncbi:hypothetical protein MIND_00986500 [Mycena indigotica]|uniref:Protein SQS1 n=1 Tax=Mycena indigotica TaxID=2126181 RepID=A0A8H6SDL7_9AGAR|nr:uncharacterized protein MIND_00986500 [Mycena indigotica]KAF7297523.1 hypothetical protein MIND_00986500 [Mycena indigotica]
MDRGRNHNQRGRGRGRGRGGRGGRGGQERGGSGKGGRGRGTGGGGPGRGTGTARGGSGADFAGGPAVNIGRGGNGRGRSRGGPQYNLSVERNTMLQLYPDYTTGVPLPSHSASSSPSQRGYRGRGIGSPQRGRGFGKHNRQGPLSTLLSSSYLQPIVFVRSVYTTTLFENEDDEELMQPLVEDVGDDENEHVPTADRVARVFSGSLPPLLDLSGDEEQLEEIDFSDLGRIQAQVDAAAAAGVPLTTAKDVAVVEEKFTGIWINKPAIIDASIISSSSLTHNEPTIAPPSPEPPFPSAGNDVPGEPSLRESEQAFDDSRSAQIVTDSSNVHSPPSPEPPLFFVDTSPTPITAAEAPPPGAEASLSQLLDRHRTSQLEEDEEIIVYVAPHPRTASRLDRTPSPETPSSRAIDLATAATSVLTGIEPPAFSSVSFSVLPTASTSSPRKPPPTAALTAHGRKKAKIQAQGLGKRVQRRAGAFGASAAILAEARLREEDPRKNQRRKGDSDVDWGDSDEDEGADEDTGMLVDPDLDPSALARFARGLLSQEGGRWVTMDDVEDEIKMREEDESELVSGESGEDSGSESDEDPIVCAEEAAMVGESSLSEEDDMSDSDYSEDLDQSPRAAFQTKLDRARQAAKGKQKADEESMEMEELFWDESEDDEFLEPTWREKDDDFAAEIQAILDENGDILASSSPRGRKALFKAAVNGDIDFDDIDFKPAKRGKKKRDDIPAELQDIWDRDRAKKAENKQRRALARLELAADPMAAHKGGKKGRKAMLAAARVDPTITVLPNRVIDLTTLVQQIRRFVADLGGPANMSLPPTDKATRASVHELANAFGLKSVSKGKGMARYTTLTKTTRTGIRVDEKKIGWICRRGGARGASFVNVQGADKGKGPAMPRHKDGDEVGKAAPKIGESNLGFKMLASMGWSEGQRIGAAADGLHVPLKAVIKNSKLGLGAMR